MRLLRCFLPQPELEHRNVVTSGNPVVKVTAKSRFNRATVLVFLSSFVFFGRIQTFLILNCTRDSKCRFLVHRLIYQKKPGKTLRCGRIILKCRILHLLYFRGKDCSSRIFFTPRHQALYDSLELRYSKITEDVPFPRYATR